MTADIDEALEVGQGGMGGRLREERVFPSLVLKVLWGIQRLVFTEILIKIPGSFHRLLASSPESFRTCSLEAVCLSVCLFPLIHGPALVGNPLKLQIKPDSLGMVGIGWLLGQVKFLHPSPGARH